MDKIIDKHKKIYPNIQDQDIYKLIFQSHFGSGHAISNKFKALSYILNELETLQPNKIDLYEEISTSICRVNLSPYKTYGLDPYYLFEVFLKSSDIKGNKEDFINDLNKAKIPFTRLDNVHHSDIYRQTYNPHYRIIEKQYITQEMKDIQVMNFLNNIKGKKIIAIEGKCAAGKTTVSKMIETLIGATIINVDDFFLPIERKTESRMNEIGGNIDYERIYKILSEFKTGSLNSFHRFNCSTQLYEEVMFIPNDIIILEGVYSYHPSFRHLIDHLIYIDIDEITQLERLRKRSNYDRFINEWIPLENKYFDLENIKYLADIIV